LNYTYDVQISRKRGVGTECNAQAPKAFPSVAIPSRMVGSSLILLTASWMLSKSTQYSAATSGITGSVRPYFSKNPHERQRMLLMTPRIANYPIGHLFDFIPSSLITRFPTRVIRRSGLEARRYKKSPKQAHAADSSGVCSKSGSVVCPFEPTVDNNDKRPRGGCYQ